MKWWLLILIPLVSGIIWWLYENGYACYNSKSAATFLGRPHMGPRGFGAAFTACTGNFGRYLKLKRGGALRFTLSATLSQGNVQAQVRRKRDILAVLDRDHPEAVAELEAHVRYTLELRFVRASGSCSLHWDDEDRR